MAYGNRHFGRMERNNEEIIIIGYNPADNVALVVFPAAMAQQEAQMLRAIVGSADAQKKDYLMDSISGSVLGAAHHPSGVNWETYLIKQTMTRGSTVRKIPLKEIVFADQTQKAFYSGYGPSIEPEVDARRRGRLAAQSAMLEGRVIPVSEAAIAAAAPAPAPAANDALTAALAGITQTNQMILEQLARMNASAAATPSPAAAPKTPRRKPGPRAKPKANPDADAPVDTVSAPSVAADSE